MNDTSIAPVTDFLSRHAPFDQMAPAHLDYLAKRLKQAYYAKGEVVTGPEEGTASRFYIIKQGCVRGESGEDGNPEGAWELHSGECFPIGALLSRRPVRLINRAVEDTFCFELERNDFDTLLQQSPVFQDFCTRRMANLLDNALRGIQARSAARMSEASSLDTQIQKLIQRRPISCQPDCSIRAVLETMADLHIGCMVITDKDKHPVGMLSMYDVPAHITLPQRDLDTPVSAVMSEMLLKLGPDTPAYEAALQMTRTGIGHVCVTDKQNRLIGVLSERDLFSLQRVGLVRLSRAIQRAEDIDTLARLEQDIHRLIEQMIAQGASVAQLTQIITEFNDSLTQRVIGLIMASNPPPPVPFTWLSFGSEGRFEQTLNTDQDNGILFQVPEGADAEAIRQQLLPLAKQINDALDSCGFPLCPGNIMASNPECCLSLEEWRVRFGRWIDQGTPEHLLYATIYFDYRPLWGESEASAELRDWLTERVERNSRFRRQMAANALRNRPPLGLFGDFKVSSNKADEPHTIDLKVSGITPFVDGARILAFATRSTATNTIARLKDAANTGAVQAGDVAAWEEAYHYIQLLRMRNHRRQAEEGRALSNRFNPDDLNELDSRILKEAFRQARKLQSKIALDYQL